MKQIDYQIYNNLLDLDLYTLSMCYVVLNEFPRAYCKWSFFDRNNTIYPKGFDEELKRQISSFKYLSISNEEIEFLKKKLYYLPHWFFNFLKSYKFDENEVTIKQDSEGHLNIDIEGLWWRTIFWEQPLLETISEMYHYKNGNLEKVSEEQAFEDGYKKGNILLSNNIKFAEFGCRRRLSYNTHKNVLKGLCEVRNEFGEEGKNFIGTSDIHLAYVANKEFNTDLSITGTMAHSFVTNIAALYGPVEANSIAMNLWTKNFNSDLGIFLPDGVSWKGFESNFSKLNAKTFDGLRHDSGDEIEITNKFVEKYKELGVDPKTKSIVYSNGLTDIDYIIKLNDYAKNLMKPSFGLGGFFTCNFRNENNELLTKGLNIVIKSVACKITEKREYNNVVKIPFDLNKAIGDKKTIDTYNFLLHN